MPNDIVPSAAEEIFREISASTSELTTMVQYKGLEVIIRLISAFVIWYLGRIVIRWLVRIFEKLLVSRGIEATVASYVVSIVKVVSIAILTIAVLGWLGIETAGFVGLLAGAGLAIGTAWGGLLTHLAAGLFMVMIRPFRVGDVISAAGVQGTVEEIGLVVTRITTFDNVRTIIGNNRIFSDNIINYSANPFRRVELTVVVDHGADLVDIKARIGQKLVEIPNVLELPSPQVEILDFTLAGPRLAVRPFCDNRHYFQVLFDTNRAIHTAMHEAGYAVPTQRYQIEPSK